jgi:hypothetical protein
LTSRVHGRVVNEQTPGNRGQGRHLLQLKAVGAGSTSQAVPRPPGRSPSRRNPPPSASAAGRYNRHPPSRLRHPLLAVGCPFMGGRCTRAHTEQTRKFHRDRRITRSMGQRESSVEIVSCREWDSYAISYLCWFYRLECSERRWQYNGSRFTRYPARPCLQNQAPPGRLG